MPSVEDIIEAELQLNSCELWLKVWRPIVRRLTAAKLFSMTDLTMGKPIGSWAKFDDPVERSKLFSITPQLKDECLKSFKPETSRLNDALHTAGYNKKRSASQMKKHLSLILPAALKWPLTNAALVDSPFPEAWAVLAEILAKQASDEIEGICRAGLANALRDDASHSERTLHVVSLLSGYFRSCRMSEARLVENDLAKFGARMIGVRGSLVRIAQNVSAKGIGDLPISSSLRKTGVSLHHEHLLHLMKATAEESRQIASNNGFMHRTLPANPQDDRRRRQGQLAIYLQYESTVLAYLALSCIEQLIRAWATHEGISTFTNNGRPASILNILTQLPCEPATIAHIEELWDSSRSNIRNRIMHGGLLDVISKHQELILHVADPTRFPLSPHWGRDEFSPENICRLCLDCLEQIDADVARRAVLTEQHLSWAASMRLNPMELSFGDQLPFDFVGPNGKDAWARVSNYLNAVVPSAKQFVTIGFRGALGQNGPHTMVQFVSMILVFEILYRSTVQFHGFRVLQVAPGHMQYRMLDELQLCAEPIVQALVKNVAEVHRTSATRVLDGIKQIRNAFAHGAIEELDQYTKDGLCRLVMKGVQCLVDAGIHKMTADAAFFLWDSQRGRQHGLDMEDWLAAEDTILAELDHFAKL
jgi:hypothetical protein